MTTQPPDRSVRPAMLWPDLPKRWHGAQPGAGNRVPALLSKANRELAGLLGDLRGQADAALADTSHGYQISRLLRRAARCALQQYRLQARLGRLALTDELTGLYNRRGFLVLAEQQLRLARRSGRGLWLFFIDVDGLKRINDSWGHAEGDRVLIRAAEVLEKTFRDADVVARLGGDEFTVLAIEASGCSEAAIIARLHEHLRKANATDSRYRLALSAGVARFAPGCPISVEQLIGQADQAMYESKRRRAGSPQASSRHRVRTKPDPQGRLAAPGLDAGLRVAPKTG